MSAISVPPSATRVPTACGIRVPSFPASAIECHQVVASFDAAASKFVGLRQGDTSLGVWNATFTKDGDCAGDAVPRACYKTLANTFEVDGLAMVISLWKVPAIHSPLR